MQLLEMEKELSGPDRDAAITRYDGVLADLEALIAGALRDGLAPDDYSRA